MASKVEDNRPKRQKTGGRKKGTPNKTTQATKDAIKLVAEKLGGVERLTEWAQEDPDNEKAFWVSIYPKLLPLDVNASGSLTINLPAKTRDIL